MSLTFDDATTLLLALWKSGLKTGFMQTVCLLGKPGIGKTAIGRGLCAHMEAHMKTLGVSRPPVCEVLDLSSFLPEDLMGLPHIKQGGDRPVTGYAEPTWLARLTDPDAYGIVIFDDLPAATTAVQVATRQASLERRIHEARFAPGIFVLVTGNRREDKSAASTLPAHFRNSVALLEIDADFGRWEYYARENGVDGLIPAYLTWKPSMFSRAPVDADAVGAFATPRTWTMLGRQVEVARGAGRLREFAAALVGDGVAVELAAFDLLRKQLADPKEVLKDPQRAIPDPEKVLDTPDKAIAMATGLGEVAANLTKEAGSMASKVKAAEAFLQALAWCFAKKHDLVATAITTFQATKGDYMALNGAVKTQISNPQTRPLLQAIQRCFSA